VASHSASALKRAAADMKKLSETSAAKDLKRAISALMTSEATTMPADRNSKLARANVKRGQQNSTMAEFPQTLKVQDVSNRKIRRTLEEFGRPYNLDQSLKNDAYAHFRAGHHGPAR
jgi:hypothetical protein